jgi:hypothetical protein
MAMQVVRKYQDMYKQQSDVATTKARNNEAGDPILKAKTASDLNHS